MKVRIDARVAIGATALLTLASVANTVHAQSLRGSRASVSRMHTYATAHDLRFLRNSTAVRSAAKKGSLVRLRANTDLGIGAVAHPYLRPATATFVRRLADQYHAACGQRLVVTGATRPLSVRLANASPRSVHPTGIAVDLRRPRGRCLTWLRRTLLSLEGRGLIEATEERRPPHFHVVVFEVPYRKYLAQRGIRIGGTTQAAAGGR